MLDIKFIRENIDLVKKAIQDKGVNLDLDRLIDVDNKRRKLLQEIESIKAVKNKVSQEITGVNEEKRKGFLEEMKKADKQEELLKDQLQNILDEYNNLMYYVPQIPCSETPIDPRGKNNKVEKKSGEIPEFDFTVKDHLEIGKELDLIDFERGVKLTGTRGYCLKNEAAQIEWSLMMYGLDFLRKRGFTLLQPPVLLPDKFFYGTGHFPQNQEEIFLVKNKEKENYLAGTAEVPLVGYFSNEILKEEDLPIRLTACTPCFRTEIGSYGKDVKGLYRLKQFYKVEQVILCKNDDQESKKMFQEILKNAEEFLQSLNFPYQVLRLCSGDMGLGKVETFDIETWMPSWKAYRETQTCSRFGDWQARRSNIKYKTKNKEKLYIHTLNNTLIASPRILIPLLELNQQKEGSVNIPEVLEKYCGFKQIKKYGKGK